MHGADLPWYYNSLILPAPAARILKGKFRARNAQAAEAHPSLSPPAQPEVRHEHTQGIQLLRIVSGRRPRAVLAPAGALLPALIQ